MYVMYRPDGTIHMHSMTEEACWVQQLPAILTPAFKAADFVDLLKKNGWRVEPVVVIPLDQWRRLVELADAWNSGDCCAAIADDMAGIIAKIGVQHE